MQGVETDDAFERLNKSMSAMAEALSRLQTLTPDNSLGDTASLIEAQARSDEILKRLRDAVAAWT